MTVRGWASCCKSRPSLPEKTEKGRRPRRSPGAASAGSGAARRPLPAPARLGASAESRRGSCRLRRGRIIIFFVQNMEDVVREVRLLEQAGRAASARIAELERAGGAASARIAELERAFEPFLLGGPQLRVLFAQRLFQFLQSCRHAREPGIAQFQGFPHLDVMIGDLGDHADHVLCLPMHPGVLVAKPLVQGWSALCSAGGTLWLGLQGARALHDRGDARALRRRPSPSLAEMPEPEPCGDACARALRRRLRPSLAETPAPVHMLQPVHVH